MQDRRTVGWLRVAASVTWPRRAHDSALARVTRFQGPPGRDLDLVSRHG